MVDWIKTLVAMTTQPPLTYNGENDNHVFSVAFDLILFGRAGDRDMHNISDDLKFWPDQPTDCGVICP